MSALNAVLPDIRSLGAELLVLSPQLPANSLELRRQQNLGFDLLFDEGNKTAESYGLAMQLPPDLVTIYKGFGIDLPAVNGDESWRLPVPARVVIAKGGAVVGIEADPDYTRRPEPEETLAVLRGAA
ncbi:MAG: redoxin domain-containing protein [Proteobacteria bacterium]|nr:redoxin domain-containing protein [Pseudomonadota bacterium]